MVNLSGTLSDVKVYTVNGAAPGSASSLPDWLTRRRALKGNKRSSKEEVEAAIDLIQDFNFPEASNKVKTTRDGHHVYATGTYKPCMRVYDLDQLTIKFERHTNAENVDFLILSDDWTKTLHLQDNRTIEFHNQAGLYYSTRVPRQGRALAYHYPSCDVLMGCVGNEIFRLNLDQGRYLNSLTLSSDVEGVNAIDINPAHQLLAFATEASGAGTVEFWDPRARSRVAILRMPHHQILPVSSDPSKSPSLEVTALSFRSDGLSLAIGTSTGHALLYDLRSPHHYALKDQGYGLPMKNVCWVEGGMNMAGDGMVISADSKVIKIWDRNTPTTNFASVTPATDVNHLHHVPGSGLIMLATEGPRMSSYYIPQLGPAPRWCSFLDHITEEMEESAVRSVYEDFKFVERTEMRKLGMDHLIGTKTVKPYMHGYFVPLKLYDAARVVHNPFAYEEHHENLVKQKVEKLVESRIRSKKVDLPKVNRALAERLQKEYEKKQSILAKRGRESGTEEKGKQKAVEVAEVNVLQDPRFREMFTDPDFEVDPESREYELLRPGAARSNRAERRSKTAVEQEAEESDKSSSDGLGMASSSSSASSSKPMEEDSDEEGRLVDMSRLKGIRQRKEAARREVQSATPARDRRDATLRAFPHFNKFIAEQPKPTYVVATSGSSRTNRDAVFGERRNGETSKAKADDPPPDGNFDGLEMTWESAETNLEGRPNIAIPKEMRRKGVQSFGAGMEKGGVESSQPIPESQRQGRAHKRSQLRSASKNTFRSMK